MKINNILSHYDPSRYTVYQMLDYTKDIQDIKLIQKQLKNVYLFKTTPFVNELYNYAHIINPDFSKEDLENIEKFFGDSQFKIKFPEDKNIEKVLLSSWYIFEDVGYIMVADISQDTDYSISLPQNVTVAKVDNIKALKDYKLIFEDAFDCDLDDINQKFGFFDDIIMDQYDDHINTFVLYEDGIPASTGAYYAFDNFSIENIGTRNEYRGKWYAYIIMKFLLQEAKKLSYKKACLVASEAGSHVYKNVWFNTLTKTNTFVLNNQ